MKPAPLRGNVQMLITVTLVTTSWCRAVCCRRCLLHLIKGLLDCVLVGRKTVIAYRLRVAAFGQPLLSFLLSAT